jgi:acetyltransferase-like isoleucine patch superfamily enzyme
VRGLAEAFAAALVLPLRLAHRTRLVTFVGVAHLLAPLPGQFGRFVRRAWYSRELAACGRNLVVDFGAAIRTPHTRIGDDCYFGLYNWVGLADIGDDFMSGSHVVILSGGRTHGFTDLARPMRLQGTEMERITIGDDVWVGAQAAILVDVAPHSIVATGAVVTKRFDEFDMLGGVPAAPIGNRRTSPPLPGPAAR